MAVGSKWTDKGQEKCIDLIDPATRGAVSSSFFGAWGSGATTPAVGDTALVTENPESRVACTVSQPAADTVRWVYSITSTAARTVQETGVFDASTVGNMWVRIVHGSLSLDAAGDIVTYTINLQLKDSSE